VLFLAVFLGVKNATGANDTAIRQRNAAGLKGMKYG